VHNVLTEGHHRRHVQTLNATLLNAQATLNAKLTEVGLTPFTAARGGMFTWATIEGCELSAREIADRARQKGSGWHRGFLPSVGAAQDQLPLQCGVCGCAGVV
jgi:DNA-binding transcriptional MocR family regulator